MAYDFEQFNRELRAIRAKNRIQYARIEKIAGKIENPTDDRTMDIMVQAYRRAASPTLEIHGLILPEDERIIRGSHLWRDWIRKHML